MPGLAYGMVNVQADEAAALSDPAASAGETADGEGAAAEVPTDVPTAEPSATATEIPTEVPTETATPVLMTSLRMNFENDELRIKTDENYDLELKDLIILPEDTADRSLKWKTADESIAELDTESDPAKVTIKPKAEGKTEIRVESALNENVFYKFTLIVESEATATAVPADTSIPENPEATATAVPADTSMPENPEATATAAPADTSVPENPEATATAAPADTSVPENPEATATAVSTETSIPENSEVTATNAPAETSTLEISETLMLASETPQSTETPSNLEWMCSESERSIQQGEGCADYCAQANLSQCYVNGVLYLPPPPSATPVEVPVSGLAFAQAAYTVEVSGIVTPVLVFSPANASNQMVTYSLSDPTVVTVNPATGSVIALSEGSSVLKACSADGGYCAETTINVGSAPAPTATATKDPSVPVQWFNIGTVPIEIKVGESKVIQPYFYPENAAPITLRWTSSDPAVASVDSETNTVTGEKEGSAVLGASSLNGALFANNTVIVRVGEGTATPVPSVTQTEAAGLSAPAKPTVEKDNEGNAVGLKISWNEIPGATAYSVYRSDEENGTYTLVIPLQASDGTSYTDTVPALGKTFYYKLAYSDGTNTSALSEAASGIIPMDQITISVAITNGTQYTISWTPHSDLIHYDLLYSESIDGYYTNTSSSQGTQNSITTGFGEIGKTYYFKVIPSLGGVPGPESNIVSAIVEFGIPVISDVTQIDVNHLKISWNSVTGANLYHVYRSDTEDGTYIEITDPNLDAGTKDTSFIDAVTEYQKEYYYKVAAGISEKYVFGQKSEAKSGKIDMGTPDAPAVEEEGNINLKISWKQITGAKTYSIYRSDESTGDYALITPAEGIPATDETSYSYTDTVPALGKTFYYKLAYSDGTNTSAQSEAASGIIPMDAPTLSITQTEGSLTSYTLTTTSVGTEIEYHMLRAKTAGSEYSDIGSFTDVTIPFVTSVPKLGETYQYKVVPYLESVPGPESNVVEAIAYAGISAPVISSIEQTDAVHLIITWSEVAEAEGYEILYSETEDGTYTQKTVTATADTSCTVSVPSLGKTYYYKVAAVISSISGPESDPQTGMIEMAAPVISSVTKTGATQMKITWSEVTGADKYQVYRSESADSGFSILGEPTADLSYTDTTAAAAKVYYYKVQALITDAGTNTLIPGPESAAVSGVIPAAPKISSITAASTTTLKISWGEVKGASGYRIYRSDAASGSYALIAALGNVTSVTTTVPVLGTVYYYKVSAVSNSGEGAQSAAVGGKTVIAVPRISSITAASTTTLKISWGAVSGATGYRLYRSASAASGFAAIATLGNVTSVTSTVPMLGYTYYYKVAPLIGSISGPLSAAVSGKITIATPKISSVAVSGGSLKISWGAVSGATGYKLYRSASATSGFTAIATLGKVTSVFSGAPALNTVYYYKVAPLIGNISGPLSAAVSGKITIATPKISSVTVSGGSLKISWGAVSGATGYRLYRSTSSTSGFAVIATLGKVTSVSSGVSALNTVYYYKVAPLIGSLSGSLSAAVSGKITIGASKITRIAAANATALQVTWGAVNGATGYRLYRSASATTGFSVIATLGKVTTAATVVPYLGTTYYYKVVPMIGTLAGPLSAAASGKVAIPAGKIASITSSGAVHKLSWAAVPGATGYKLYRSVSATTGFAVVGTYGKVTAVSISVPALNTVYYYKMAVISGTAVGSMGAEVNGKSSMAAPKITSVAAASATTLKISWSAVTGATGYQLYRSASATSGFTTIATLGNVTTITTTVPTLGTAIYYKIAPLMGKLLGPLSAAVSGKISMAAPKITSVTAASATALKVSWSAVTGATGYQLYRSVSATTGFSVIATLGKVTTVTTPVPLLGTTYYYKIVPLIGTIPGLISVAVAGKVAIPAPHMNSPVQTSPTTLQLSWTAVSGASGYRIWQSATSATEGFAALPDITSGTTKETEISVTPNITYYFKIAAVLGSVVGSASAAVSGKVSDVIPHIDSITVSGKTGLTIHWNSISGAAGYKVYTGSYEMMDDSAFLEGVFCEPNPNKSDDMLNAYICYKEVQTIQGGDNTTWTYTVPNAESTYNLAVAAVYGEARGTVSNLVSGKTPVLAGPETVTVAASDTPGQLTVSWSQVEDATGYIVSRSRKTHDDPFDTDVKTIEGGNVLSWVDSTMPTMTEVYYYKVTALIGSTKGSKSTAEGSAQPKSLEIPENIIISPTINPGEINVSWDAVNGATGYTVHRASSVEYSNYWIDKDSTVVTTTWTDTTVPSTQDTYYYKVAAVIGNTVGPYSEYASGKSKAFNGPDSITVTPSDNNGQLVITWTPVTGAVSYIVYRSESVDGPYSRINAVSDLTYTDTLKNTRMTYYYKIAAETELFSGSMSETYGSGKAIDKLLAPTGLNGEAYGTIGQVRLTWTAVEGATSYSVYCSDAADGTYSLYSTDNFHPWAIEKVPSTRVPYYFKVSAAMSGVEGPLSESVAAQANPFDPPSNVKIIPNIESAEKYNLIMWERPASINSSLTLDYEVWRSSSSDGEYSRIKLVNSLYYKDSDLDSSVATYYYKVASVIPGSINSSGPLSSSVSTGDLPVLSNKIAAPTGVGTMVQAWPGQVSVYWKKADSSSGVTGYQILRSTNPTSGFSVVAVVFGIEKEYVLDDTLKVDTTYYYKVAAMVGSTVGLYSTIASGRSSDLPAPTVSAAASAISGGIDLSWSKVSYLNGYFATGYQIYRSEDNLSYNVIKTIEGSDVLSWTDMVTEGKTYYYKVSALLGSLTGTLSEAVSSIPNTFSAPQNVEVRESNTAGQMILSWTAVSGASSYNIYRSSDNTVFTMIQNVTDTFWTDSTLPDTNSVYYYKVAAIKGHLLGFYSQVVSTLKLPAPTVALSGEGSEQSSVVLNWSEVEGATGYRILSSSESDQDSFTFLMDVIGGTVTTTTINVEVGKTYFYKIAALNGAIVGLYSEPVNISITAEVLPAPVYDKTTKAGDSSVRLSWNEVTGATGYRVMRSTKNAVSGFEFLADTSSNYLETNVETGVSYFYKVAALNGTVVGLYCSAILVINEEVLSAPKLSEPRQETEGKVILNWTKVDKATEYYIESSQTSDKEGFSFEAYVYYGTQTSITFSVRTGVTYYYKIAAMNGSTIGEFSNVVSICPAKKPDKPVLNQPLQIAGKKILLSWPAVEGATSYRIMDSVESRWEDFRVIGTANGSTTFTAIIDPEEDSKKYLVSSYYFKVAAIAGTLMGDYSDVVEIVPVDDIPVPVLDMPAQMGENSIFLTWSEVNNTSGYILQESTGSDQNFSDLLPTTGNNLITPCSSGITCYYRVAAKYQGALGDFSNVVSITPFETDLAGTTLYQPWQIRSGAYDICWNSLASATGYILVITDSNGETTKIPFANQNQTTGGCSGPLYGTKGLTYSIQLKALLSKDDSNVQYSNVQTFVLK